MVGHCEAGAVNREFGWAAFAPVSLAICGVQRFPCQSRHSAGGSSVIPSHQTPPSGVSATFVKMVFRDSAAIAFGFVFHGRARRDAEEAGLGVDRPQAVLGVGLEPGDVVAHGPDLPPLEPRRRDQHGEVRLAAGGGERGGDVRLLALRVLDPEDEHVLGHPALVARDVRGDPQREALLAEQRVAAVARAVRPDLARLREVDDVLLLVARPGHVLLAGRERGADGVHAGHDALLALVDLREDGQADPGHDPHADDDVGRVGELHADLRHRRADRPHAERQHVHRPPAHRAAEQLLQLAAHLVRVFPVVGRARRLLRERADEGAVLDPRDVARVGARVVAARPELLVELDEACRPRPSARRARRTPPASRPPSGWRRAA